MKVKDLQLKEISLVPSLDKLYTSNKQKRKKEKKRLAASIHGGGGGGLILTP